MVMINVNKTNMTNKNKHSLRSQGECAKHYHLFKEAARNP